MSRYFSLFQSNLPDWCTPIAASYVPKGILLDGFNFVAQKAAKRAKACDLGLAPVRFASQVNRLRILTHRNQPRTSVRSPGGGGQEPVCRAIIMKKSNGLGIFGASSAIKEA
jgi:hypothetical protein